MEFRRVLFRSRSVGNKRVRLVDVGPAHTASDVLVHVPEDRVVYTGDILFNGGHPAIWAGPVGNWIKACDTILDWNVDFIVPGNGPVSDRVVLGKFGAYTSLFLGGESGKSVWWGRRLPF